MVGTKTFAHDLRARVTGVPQITTEGFRSYPQALKEVFGTEHRHGIAINTYEGEETDV